MDKHTLATKRIRQRLKQSLGAGRTLQIALLNYKKQNPNKADYGLSDAGILPRSTKARIAFLEECGYTSLASKKPYEIARLFTKKVNAAVGDELGLQPAAQLISVCKYLFDYKLKSWRPKR